MMKRKKEKKKSVEISAMLCEKLAAKDTDRK